MSVIFSPGPKYLKKEKFDVLQLQISTDRLKLELISDNSRKLLECIKNSTDLLPIIYILRQIFNLILNLSFEMFLIWYGQFYIDHVKSTT